MRVASHRFGMLHGLGPLLIFVLLLSLSHAQADEETGDRPTSPTSRPAPVSKASPRGYKGYGYDHARFFSKRTGGVENWEQRRKEYINVEINPERTALVLVDLAEYDYSASKEFAKRKDELMIPNVGRLVELFRKHDMLIVYLTIGTETWPACMAPSPERMGNQREFIVRKFSPGAFATSPLDNLLKEHGIATLVVVGEDTSACVLCTLTGAHDRNYQTILIEDATASYYPDLHEAAVKIWAFWAYVRTTDQVINDYPWTKWLYPKLRGDAGEVEKRKE